MDQIWAKRYGQDFCAIFKICYPKFSEMRTNYRPLMKLLIQTTELFEGRLTGKEEEELKRKQEDEVKVSEEQALNQENQHNMPQSS